MSDPNKGEGQELGRTAKGDETERAIKGSTGASSAKQRSTQSGSSAGAQRKSPRAPKDERGTQSGGPEAEAQPSSGSTGSQGTSGGSQGGSGTRGGEGSRGGPGT
jgi:hypothetical protein